MHQDEDPSIGSAINQLHVEDVTKARDLLRSAITEAGNSWLPTGAVIDALTLELIDLAGRHQSPGQVAKQLTQLAALLDDAHSHAH